MKNSTYSLVNFNQDPTTELYYHIQNFPLKIAEKNLARIFSRARFDPRLMEVATEFVRDYWWNLNPEILNHQLKISQYPFAIKPAVLAILQTCSFPSPETKGQFLAWRELALRGIKDPPPQLFYIGLNKIGSKSMFREEDEALNCFLEHNLIAKDLPFNKGQPKQLKAKNEISSASYTDSLKSNFALQIRNFKVQNGLNNKQTMAVLKINRSFMTKILNNKLDGITVDYLAEKAQTIRDLQL